MWFGLGAFIEHTTVYVLILLYKCPHSTKYLCVCVCVCPKPLL
jgi:hypothetical protein